MPGGFLGKYLIVDLSKKSFEVVEPGEDVYKDFLSGYGLGAYVLTQRQKAGIDPLSPEAHLGFCSGLLTGTGAMFSGRYMLVGKSPLTGGWGDANSGGFFSLEIKRSGYDAVFFTGASKDPVWVHLADGEVQFNDAKDLWGKDAVETEEMIREKLGDKKTQIACIGQSGEKVSLISGVVTDAGRIAARSGLGAVMGIKKVKAFYYLVTLCSISCKKVTVDYITYLPCNWVLAKATNHSYKICTLSKFYLSCIPRVNYIGPHVLCCHDSKYIRL